MTIYSEDLIDERAASDVLEEVLDYATDALTEIKFSLKRKKLLVAKKNLNRIVAKCQRKQWKLITKKVTSDIQRIRDAADEAEGLDGIFF